MSFDLTNTQTMFMDLMNRVFWSYLDSFVIVFIDNIFVYSKNEAEHMNYLTVLLQVLKENELFAKLENVSLVGGDGISWSYHL